MGCFLSGLLIITSFSHHAIFHYHQLNRTAKQNKTERPDCILCSRIQMESWGEKMPHPTQWFSCKPTRVHFLWIRMRQCYISHSIQVLSIHFSFYTLKSRLFFTPPSSNPKPLQNLRKWAPPCIIHLEGNTVGHYRTLSPSVIFIKRSPSAFCSGSLGEKNEVSIHKGSFAMN